MKILGKVAAWLIVLISLTACATSGVRKPSPADNYSFRHKDFDLRYAWKTSQTEQGVRVDGLLKNVRYANMGNITLNVSLLNKGRTVISAGSSFPRPQNIQMDDCSSFELLLKNAKLSEGDLLQFQVSYSASEGSNALSWISNFTVNATKGTLVGVGDRTTNDEW